MIGYEKSLNQFDRFKLPDGPRCRGNTYVHKYHPEYLHNRRLGLLMCLSITVMFYSYG